MTVGEPAPGGQNGVPRHLLQHLLPLFQGYGAVLNSGDGQQIFHHDNQSISVCLDIVGKGGVFF